MATARQSGRQQGEWSTFVAVLLIFAFLAAWALIPTRMFEEILRAEMSQIASWGGEATREWVGHKTAEWIAGLSDDAQRQIERLGGSGIEAWLKDRIYASVLWASIAAYRVQVLVMWSLLGLPLLIAASIDGFYVREIRKTAFISQSPIRHKIGVHFFRLVTIAMMAWLLLPLPMPLVAAPAVIVFAAVSLWLWVGNLQKRL